MKIFSVMVAVFFTGTVIGFNFRGCHIENDIREEQYQREIDRCDRIIEENDRLLKLINSNEPDCMEAWENYMLEQSLLECCPV